MHRFISGALVVLICGCQGTKQAADPNAVLGPPPPRISLQQSEPDSTTDAAIQQAGGIEATSDGSGIVSQLDSTVVARISGQPVFAADVLRPMRPAIETQRMMLERLPAEQQSVANRQLDTQIRGLMAKTIPDFIDREVVLRDLERTLKPEQVEGIRGEIDKLFNEKLDEVVTAAGLTSRAELETVLGQPNEPRFEKAATAWVKSMQTNPSPSLTESHDAFTKLVMAAEYLRLKSDFSKDVSRTEMLSYYRDHAEEYDMPLEVKWDQIVVRFEDNGGKAEAARVMKAVLQKLEQGQSFASVAKEHSNGATSSDGGARSWIQEGSLADSELEEELFELSVGQVSRVAKRDDRLEIVRCADRRGGTRKSFEEMQDGIREILLTQRAQEARRETLDKMRENTDVVILFNATQPQATERFPMFN